jgi:murein L,D-transpeptidase YafK
MRSLVLPLCAFLLVSGAERPSAEAAKKVTTPTRVARAAENAKASLAPLLKSKSLRLGDEVFLRAFKEEAELEVWLRHDEKFELLKTYDICAASGELGPKQRVGDEQVPEGFYSVAASAMNPASSYHLSFNVGYPNAYDKKLGRTGSLIMIHGDCVSIGCLAMTDEGIEEIYTLVDAAHRGGQKAVQVQLLPFRLTKKKLAQHKASEWHSFWQNLKEGYDLFEKDRLPPKVSVKDGEYVFE